MRTEQFEQLKRGDVVCHQKEPCEMGLVVTARTGDDGGWTIYVIWEHGQREWYKEVGDAPKLWLY